MSCLYFCKFTCIYIQGRRKSYQIPWTWSYRWLLATMWLLGTKPGSFAGTASALNHWNPSDSPLVPTCGDFL